MDDSVTTSTNVILLDIEGTTTSISFVKDVLFPYARQHLPQFLMDNWSDPAVAYIVKQVAIQYGMDVASGIPNVPPVHCEETDDPNVALSSVLRNLLWQMDQDRKTTSLKALQGMIWKSGYELGQLTSHVFPDLQPALAQWTGKGKKVYIYSSGSIEAQKLLFAHTERGSLCHYLSGYFDTTTGPKICAESYSKIAQQINTLPHNITFFTDLLQEADAAMEAGLEAVVMIRPGNPVVEIDKNKYRVAQSFEGFY